MMPRIDSCVGREIFKGGEGGIEEGEDEEIRGKDVVLSLFVFSWSTGVSSSVGLDLT